VLVGARVVRVSGTNTGNGSGTAVWVKSRIFRVPAKQKVGYAQRLGETDADRLFSFTPKGLRADNLYKLTNGTYTTTDPRRPELVVKVYYGGHDIFLDDTEVGELTAAGYGAYIT
jgi:hypothetical protein